MKVELISFRYNMRARKRLNLLAELVNRSQSDLVVFCGYSIFYQDSIPELQKMLKNKKSIVLFEVRNTVDGKETKGLFVIKNGKILNLHTSQLFVDSKDIKNNEALGERFIYELETKRSFRVSGKSCLVIQCGENNIIRNIQKEENRPVFRFQKRPDLGDRFKKLLMETDIILNPIHTPMGNQPKMQKRREYLSADGRCYFSVSQLGTGKQNENYLDMAKKSKRLQYAYYDGQPINAYIDYPCEDYKQRIYDIL